MPWQAQQTMKEMRDVSEVKLQFFLTTQNSYLSTFI